jgi:type IX secretion system PorP/SprF family membrane protein
MKRTVLSLLLLIFLREAICQQDPQYNTYQFNQMIINPAYAGARDLLAVVATRRQQWVGINGAPVTNCLSIHGPIRKKKFGLGLTLLNDEMGPRNVVAIYGNAAYILKVSDRMKLSFGLNAGYNRYQFKFGSIGLRSGQLPTELASTQNHGALDINGGLYLRSKTFFMGFSAAHLNKPSVYTYESTGAQNKYSYPLKSHLYFTLCKSFTINENLVFAPSTLVKLVDGRTGADLNLNFFLYSRLWLGAFYRTGYGPGALMQFYFNNKLRAALSYDAGIQDQSKLGSSFEVMIGFDFSGKAPVAINPRLL